MSGLRALSGRVFLLAFAGFFLLGGAWAVALPVNGTYDEKQHIVRAYAVWSGQWLPTHANAVDATGYPTEGFDAPPSLLPANADCTWYPLPPKPASCQQVVVDRELTVMPSSAGRYSPIYPLLVGLPIRLSPERTGVVWARLLSAALGALLLAAAAAVALRAGGPLAAAAVALVGTPLAMNLNGSINPNGTEIAAGVLLFVSLLALLRSAEEHRPRFLLGLAGVALGLMLTVRHLGPVLAAGVLVACAIAARPGRLRPFLRDRQTWLILGSAGFAGFVFAVYWALVSSVTNPAVLEQRRVLIGPGEILIEIATDRGGFYVKQVVAQFGYGETTVSPIMILVWYGLFAAMVVPALRFAGSRIRAAVVLTTLTCVALLVGLELYFVPRLGWYSHGRYIMPLGVGAVLIAGFARGYANWLSRRGWLHRFAVGAVLLTVPLHGYALARVMTRYNVGIDAGLNPWGGSWQPATGAVVPLLACLVGGALLTVLVRPATVRPPAQHSTVDTLSN